MLTGSVNLNATNFIPTWPASCPWVTVVGGTQVKANATAEPGAEEVWNRDLTLGFFSSGGGGFSNNFPTPSYQKQPVKTYIQDLKKSDPGLLKHFNANGVCLIHYLQKSFALMHLLAVSVHTQT